MSRKFLLFIVGSSISLGSFALGQNYNEIRNLHSDNCHKPVKFVRYYSKSYNARGSGTYEGHKRNTRT